MILIHPRRYFRNGTRFFRREIFLWKCRLHHVACHLGENSQVYGCRILSHKNGEIVIGDNCVVKHCIFGFTEQHGRIVIADNVVINAHPYALSGLFVRGGSTITVGENALISDSVEISTTDWHWMIDERGTVMNRDQDVRIGNHVWICRRVLIGKGVTIGDGAVIGAGSIVTKSFPDSGVLIAGNPAIVKRRGINWTRFYR